MTQQAIEQLAAQAWAKLFPSYSSETGVGIIREALEAATQALREQLYVPGNWFCPTCNFSLFKGRMRASDGAVGVSNIEVTEPCPNGCATPLERATWQQDAKEMAARAEEQMKRAIDAERQLAQAEATLANAATHVHGLRIERDSAREQLDRHVDWASEQIKETERQLAEATQERDRLMQALDYARSDLAHARGERF